MTNYCFLCNDIENELLYKSLVEFLSSKGLLNSKLGIAVSGGSDSIALLCCAIIAKQNFGLNIVAVHVEHGLRDKDSKNDADFVKNICTNNNISFYIEHIHGLNTETTGIENKARIARYSAFYNAVKKHELNAMLLSHHADDQVETILMNICRGAGLQGLSGMSKQSTFNDIILLRPYLDIPKSNITEFINKYKLEYCIDKSNFEPVYTRNKIRLKVLPSLKQVYPNYVESLTRLSSQAQNDNEYFDLQVDDFIKKYVDFKGNSIKITIDSLKNTHKAIGIRVLRKLHEMLSNKILFNNKTENIERTLSSDTSNVIYELVFSKVGAQVQTSNEIFIRRSYNHLYFSVCDIKEPIYDYEEFKLSTILDSSILCFGFEFSKCSMLDKPNGKTIQAFPNKILNKAVIRKRKQGDVIKPFGMNGSMSLKKYLIDRQVEKEIRSKIPIIAIDNNVLWVVGYGASNDLKISNEMEYTNIKAKIIL